MVASAEASPVGTSSPWLKVSLFPSPGAVSTNVTATFPNTAVGSQPTATVSPHDVKVTAAWCTHDNADVCITLDFPPAHAPTRTVLHILISDPQ